MFRREFTINVLQGMTQAFESVLVLNSAVGAYEASPESLVITTLPV